MSLNDTIAKAAANAGSQKALAEMIGVSPQNLSDYKRGRPCGYRKRAQIAAIAGESPLRALLEGISEEMRDDIPHEAEAKAAFRAMLDAFPPETDEDPEVVARRWRKR